MDMQQQSDDLMMQKRIEIMMDSHNKKVKQEIEGLKQSVMQLNDSLAELRRQMSQAKHEQRPVITAAPVHEVKTAEERPISHLPRKEEPIKPRTGDYTPDDISLNDFFYYGNKK